MNVIYVLKHPAHGYFIGCGRTWLTKQFLWSKDNPKFIYGLTFHSTLQNAREFLLKHKEFPADTGIVEFIYDDEFELHLQRQKKTVHPIPGSGWNLRR